MPAARPQVLTEQIAHAVPPRAGYVWHQPGWAGPSRLAVVNGAVGIVFAPAGRLQVVLALTVSATRQITAIDVIAEPGLLCLLRLAVLPG